MAEINIIAVIGKLRPKVRPRRTVDLEDLAAEIAEQSGFDRGDVRDLAYKFASGLIRHLKRGDYVKLGEIGNFYVVSDKNLRLRAVYRAPKAVKQALEQDFQGEIAGRENAGLDEEGYAQRWLETHPEDRVTMRDGSVRSASA